MSQVHSELHFERITRIGDLDDGPTAAQPRQVMRKLLIHNFITYVSLGNTSYMLRSYLFHALVADLGASCVPTSDRDCAFVEK